MLPDPISAHKRQLANEILLIADQTHWIIAASRFGIDPSRMGDLRHGRVARFSVERLIRLLATVDRRVEMRIVAANHAPIRWIPLHRLQEGL